MPWFGPTNRAFSDALLVHGQQYTLAGSGFGSKSRAVGPLVRSTGQAGVGNIDTGWSTFAPNTATPAYTQYNMQNRATTFSPTGAAVGAPNPFVSCIAACSHYGDVAPWTGYLSVGFSMPTRPFVLYASWWELCDPNWTFTGTFNIKQCAYSYTDGIPSDCIYIGVNPAITSNSTATTQLTTNENSTLGGTLENPDRNSHGAFWGSQPSPFYIGSGSGVWTFREMELCADSTTGGTGHGYWQITTNGSQIVNYQGRTDTFDPKSATTRNITIGASVYSGQYGPPNADSNNYGYSADHYVDVTGGSVTGNCARLVFGNNTTLATSTIRSTQVVSAWSGSSITYTFWKGALPTGATAYAHVVTESGGVLDNQFNRVVA